MNKTNKIISFLLVIQLILMCTFIPSVMATDTLEESLIVSEKNDELMPMAANNCENEDGYYIEGEPEIPVGAMPVGDSVIGSYVSSSFLNYVVARNYPADGWYYYMQDYRLPNGQLIKYHIWANDSCDATFYHVR